MLVHRGCVFSILPDSLLASSVAFEKLGAIVILDALDVEAFVALFLCCEIHSEIQITFHQWYWALSGYLQHGNGCS